MARNDGERVRALVDPDLNHKSRLARKLQSRYLALAGKGLAALLVLGSMVFVLGLAYSVVSGDDNADSEIEVTSTPGDGTEGDVTTEPTTTQSINPPLVIAPPEPFEELRYLPVGNSQDSGLRSIIRIPEGSAIASFGRVEDDGRLTGLMMIDSVSAPFLEGPGVLAPEPIEINGVPGTLTEYGPLQSYVAEWQHPSQGLVRAWGLGVSRTEYGDLLDQFVQAVDADRTGPLAGWTRFDNYESRDDSDIWRAHYLKSNGEVALVSSTLTPGPAAACASADCSNRRVIIDDDGVELLVIASVDDVDALADQLRPSSEHNARVRRLEFEPLAEVPLESAHFKLYAPQVDSSWRIADSLAHSSGRAVTEPALVLVQRDVPEIGPATAAVLVEALPPGSELVSSEFVGDSHVVLITDQPGSLIRITGWKHQLAEVEAIARLITVTDEGIVFASRALGESGVERRYETPFRVAVPRTITEDVVFAAVLEKEGATQVNMRVSAVPHYVPQAALALPRDNSQAIVQIRSRAASIVINGADITLRWEEQPGVLIELQGTDQADLVELAEALEQVEIDALAALTN